MNDSENGYEYKIEFKEESFESSTIRVEEYLKKTDAEGEYHRMQHIPWVTWKPQAKLKEEDYKSLERELLSIEGVVSLERCEVRKKMEPKGKKLLTVIAATMALYSLQATVCSESQEPRQAEAAVMAKSYRGRVLDEFIKTVEEVHYGNAR